MLAQIIDRAMAGHRYRLAAFVFMPEHVHLMIYPLAEADTIDAVLKGRFYLLDPPQQYSSLPTVHSLPAEFLDGGD
jgi:REP element-mobilizing transposase RayT